MVFAGYENISHPKTHQPEAYHGYFCSYCGTSVTGFVVAIYHHTNQNVKWLICPNCAEGSVYTSGRRVLPGASFGPVIEGLPDLVLAAYQEARNCMTIGAYTSCELICRKILMFVAVEKGAKEGLSFTSYLDELKSIGYVTPPMETWVELIREHGNKATHQLETPERERAESTMMFTAELLRLVYEMDHIGKKYVKHNGEK